MTYRIELDRVDMTKYFSSINDYANTSAEVKDYLKNCIADGYKVSKIVKTYKDGRGVDVTSKYVK